MGWFFGKKQTDVQKDSKNIEPDNKSIVKIEKIDPL